MSEFQNGIIYELYAFKIKKPVPVFPKTKENMKNCKILFKTEQTIIYALKDRWALNVIKHCMIISNVIFKIPLKAIRNLC